MYMPAKEDHGSFGSSPDRARPGAAHVGNPVLEASADGLPEQVLGLGRDRPPEQHGERPAPQQVDAVALEAVGGDAAVDEIVLVEDEAGCHSYAESGRTECEERANRRHCALFSSTTKAKSKTCAITDNSCFELQLPES